jgi:hypothetical protein
MIQLQRWAERKGTTVTWGNVIGGMQGQMFRETFSTEEDAIERERQALAGEGIGNKREPIAVAREDLGWTRAR